MFFLSEKLLVGVGVLIRVWFSLQSLAVLLYIVGLETTLPQVFHGIFIYLYEGPHNLTLMEYFMNNLHYTGKQLRKFFGNRWREKLNVLPDDLEKKDVSFLYNLFHVGCGHLAPPETSDYLRRLKEMRNIRAHDETLAERLSVQHHRNQLDKLQNLCQGAIGSTSASETGTGHLPGLMIEAQEDLQQLLCALDIACFLERIM